MFFFPSPPCYPIRQLAFFTRKVKMQVEPLVSLSWFWDLPSASPPPKKINFLMACLQIAILISLLLLLYVNDFCLDKLIIYLLTDNRFKAKTYTRFFILFKGLSHSIPTNNTVFTSVISLCLRSDRHATHIPWNMPHCPPDSVEPPHPTAGAWSLSMVCMAHCPCS